MARPLFRQPWSSFSFLLLLTILASAPLISHAATIFTVGGPAGWTTPSRAKLNYSEWASTIPFKVGDSLEFNYVYKAHTVLEVIRSDYRYCNKTHPLASFDDMSGKTVVLLSKPGNFYFIDGVGTHCEEGQKFQAKVVGAVVGGEAPAPSSPEPSVSPPAIPPAVAAASALPYASVLALFLTIIASLLSSMQSS